MGRVWRGHDAYLDRDVAIKEVLLPATLPAAERAAMVARTAREARSAARLNHPGVVTIHDVVEHEDTPWIVMEFVPGISLADWIKKNGPLGWGRVAQIGAKIADALAHAHAAGIVHRDLKPDNILVAGDRVVVTDFGIARITDSTSRLTGTGTIIGTPQYMAPEQLEGSQVGTAADIWSLGATLYTAIQGKPPFDGPTLTAVITAILTRDPAPPKLAGPLAGLLGQMLAKNPAQRPNATAVGQALTGGHAATMIGQQAAAPPQPARSDTVTIGQQGASAPTVTPATPATPATPISSEPAAPWAPTPPSVPPSNQQPYQPPYGYPAQPYGYQPQAYPYQGPPVRQRSAGQQAALAGLVVALVASVGEIVGFLATPYAGAGANKATFFVLAPYVVSIVVAVLALAVDRYRRWLLPAVLGLWAVSPAWALYDVLSLVDFHIFSDGAHWITADLVETLSDLSGTVAAVLVLVALSKSTQRGRWLGPPAVSWTLFGTVVVGGAWLAEYVASSLGPVYNSGAPGQFINGGSVYVAYPYHVLGVAALLVTVLVAGYALRQQSRAVGGAIVLGWSVVMIFEFLQFATADFYFDHKAATIKIVAGISLAVSVLVTIVYMRLSPRSASQPPAAVGQPWASGQ